MSYRPRRRFRQDMHPAIRRFNGLVDAFYRVSPARRARVMTRVRARMGRHLTPDHQVLRDFDAHQHTYRPEAVANIAKHQGVSVLWPWEYLTHLCRSVDVAEFMVMMWLSMYVPAWLARWPLVVVSLVASDVRRLHAQVSVPAWTWVAPDRIVAENVNRRGWGWTALGWLRRAQGEPEGPPVVVGGWSAAAVAGLTVLALLYPSHESAGITLAALNAAVVWEVRTTGAATNGGGFKTGATGTDWSQQDAAQYAVTDGVTAGTTTITSATANFGTDVVGNVMYVQGGTGSVTAGWYEITGRTNSTTITVDRSTGLTAGTGVTLNIGGALSDPALVASIAVVSGQLVWIKSGTYTISSASTNVAGGCLSLATVQTKYEGYNATRGDLGTAPVLQLTTGTATLITANTSDIQVINLTLDGNSQTASLGFTSNASRSLQLLVSVTNCTAKGFVSSSQVMRCSATGCTTTANALEMRSGTMNASVAADNTVAAITNSNAAATFVRCIADTNTGASSDGFGMALAGGMAINCVAYANGRDGYRFTGSGSGAVNCIAEANGGYGFLQTGSTWPNLFYCATYNNTSGATSGTFGLNQGAVTGSGSFFTNAAGQDFSLNTTAGGGAAARAAGIPGAFPGISTTGYLDIGAAQHADPASSGGGIPIIGGNIIRVHTP